MNKIVDPDKKEALTEWKNEPKIADLKVDLDASKPAHDAKIAKIEQWNHLRNVTGPAKIKKVKGRSSVQPKLIRRQAEWRYSALSEPFLGSEKLYEVSPTTFEDKDASVQNELVLNWQFNTKMNKVKFIDEYVRTAVDEGTVIVKMGWKRITETVTVKNPIFSYFDMETEEEAIELQEAEDMKSSNPNGYLDLSEEIQAACAYFLETGVPTIAEITGYEDVEEEKIVTNEPTVTIKHPDNVFFDPSCEGDYTKSSFVVDSFETSKAELKKDGRYKNLDEVLWSSQTILATPDHETSTPTDYEQKDELKKKVVAYEYWGWHDINGDELLKPISVTWIGDVIVRMEESPFPDEKPPYVVANYLPVKREVYGEPDAEILEDNQKIIGAVTRGMVDLMGRSANSQQGIAKGFMDVNNRRKFENGLDYEYNPGTDPRTSIYQHTYPEIPNSALTMNQLQNQDAESLSGVKGFSGGVSGEAYGDVAAGIRGVLDASSKREMNILRRLAKGIADIGNKVMSMNALFLSEEETIRVTNSEFIQVRREDLKGNFDLVVDISTAEVDEQKASDLVMMLQTMGPNMDPAKADMILAEIARLKRMPALAEMILNHKPEPDPMAEKMHEMEMAKIQSEIDKTLSEIDLNKAKAAQTKAETQLTTLQLGNDASGVSHDRDMQKQSAQAKGNQSLEITKGLLKSTKEGESRPDVNSAIGYNELSKMLDDPAKQETPNLGSKDFNPTNDPALNLRNQI